MGVKHMLSPLPAGTRVIITLPSWKGERGRITQQMCGQYKVKLDSGGTEWYIDAKYVREAVGE